MRGVITSYSIHYTKLYDYTNGEASGKLKDFVDFIVSPDGQNIVKSMEYIPLPPKK